MTSTVLGISDLTNDFLQIVISDPFRWDDILLELLWVTAVIVSIWASIIGGIRKYHGKSISSVLRITLLASGCVLFAGFGIALWSLANWLQGYAQAPITSEQMLQFSLLRISDCLHSVSITVLVSGISVAVSACVGLAVVYPRQVVAPQRDTP